MSLAVVMAGRLSPGGAAASDYQEVGVRDHLPVFYSEASERITHPLSWLAHMPGNFEAWKASARSEVRRCLLNPPPEAPWEAVVLDEEDRGDHVARKVVFNLSGDSRVLAYLTRPKGPGPFPAVLLLHDHGARFDIGKEKLIEPWGVPGEKIASAREWVGKGLGGRFLGDALAGRGYVCLATDVLNWSDRGGGGYEAQQSLASNLMHLGMSYAGLTAWEDMRAAEFLAAQPEVDATRVAAMGWSMGGFRAWQVAALSDHVAGAVAICWMNTVRRLMTPGNNQTRGHSAYTMLHPGLLDQLDYPDVASIACPKPMLFYNGRQDRLFPPDGVEAAYAKMRAVWASQDAEDQLVTRLWDVGHEFNTEMQEAAFAWIDRVLAADTDHPKRP